MTYQPVKGMEDFYPEKKAVLESIFTTLKTSARRFGFQEVGSPAMESIQLLTAKSGEEAKSQIFTLEKRGTDEIGLRFDLTVPITRMFVQKQKAIPKPAKWFALDRMWRYEAPQKGRSREFYQLSVELFGSARPEADADVICLAIDCLNSFGLREKDFMVRINNRKLLEGMLLQYGVPKTKMDAITGIIDKKLKVEEFLKLLLDAGLTQEVADKAILIANQQGPAATALAVIKKLATSREAVEGLAELENVIALLPSQYLSIDLSLARGLAYYTGTVFEISDREGKFRAIAGGGRYDNLVELFGGEKCPATGFAIGDKTLWLLLEEKGKLPEVRPGPDYYIVTVSDELRPEAVKLAAKLSRTHSCDIDLMGRKFMKQLEYANNIGAKNAIIIGQKELVERKVKVKDMKTGVETYMDI